MGTTLVQDEVSCEINAQNRAITAINNVIKSKTLSTKVKLQIYKVVIKPAVTHTAEIAYFWEQGCKMNMQTYPKPASYGVVKNKHRNKS